MRLRASQAVTALGFRVPASFANVSKSAITPSPRPVRRRWRSWFLIRVQMAFRNPFV